MCCECNNGKTLCTVLLLKTLQQPLIFVHKPVCVVNTSTVFVFCFVRIFGFTVDCKVRTETDTAGQKLKASEDG